VFEDERGVQRSFDLVKIVPRSASGAPGYDCNAAPVKKTLKLATFNINVESVGLFGRPYLRIFESLMQNSCNRYAPAAQPVDNRE
jgi:hypothetical protein